MIDFKSLNTESNNILSSPAISVEVKKEYKPLGRKPKKEEDKKTEKVCIYLTKEEKELLVKKSYENYMDISAFCKTRILAE